MRSSHWHHASLTSLPAEPCNIDCCHIVVIAAIRTKRGNKYRTRIEQHRKSYFFYKTLLSLAIIYLPGITLLEGGEALNVFNGTYH